VTPRRVFGLALGVAFALGASGRGQEASPGPADAVRLADELFSEGRDPARDREALTVLEAAGSASDDYDLLWRQVRVAHQVAQNAAEDERRKLLETAIGRGERAVRLQPSRVEGHYWLGACYGSYAEARGGFKAWRLASKLRTEMEAAVRLQPDFEGGDAFLALGELDLQLPGLFGGSRSRAIARMEEGLKVSPENLELRLTLARGYQQDGRRADARRLLETVVAWPVDPAHPNAGADLRRRAQRELDQLK